MPELPEVETVMCGLAPAMNGQVIDSIHYYRPNLRFPFCEELPENLSGQKMCSLIRRGKYIVGLAENGHGFILHLGMSGVVKVLNVGDPYDLQKHDHLEIRMNNGQRIVYNDARRFGFFISIGAEGWERTAPFHKMGPEPLGNSFNGHYLFEALRKRNGPIKVALLDQGLVAGIGNIYACEALYKCGILPQRPGSDLSIEACERLVVAIREVLTEAIEAGGSSLRDYRNTKGKMGYFQHHFSVYDREGQACPLCAGQGRDCQVHRIVQAGRSTFYCEYIQK